MHTRLLTQINDRLQLLIVLQCKRNRNFIQLVLRKNILDILYSSHNINSLIHSTAWHRIVENSPDHIAPLWISNNSGNIFLCCTGISNQQNVLQVITLSSEKIQNVPDHRPAQGHQNDIDDIKGTQHESGDIKLIDHIQQGHEQDQPYGISFHNCKKLVFTSGCTLWCI